MNQNLCEIGVCPRSVRLDGVDETGSHRWIQRLPGVPTKVARRSQADLVLFDHEYIVAHDGRPVKEVPKLDEHTYVPRGTTALLDAMGRTINTIGERVDKTPGAGATRQSDRLHPDRRSGECFAGI